MRKVVVIVIMIFINILGFSQSTGALEVGISYAHNTFGDIPSLLFRGQIWNLG